jgi:hypothetical protein
MLNIVWELSLVLSVDCIENKHDKNPSANSSLCHPTIFLQILKSCVSGLSTPMMNIELFNMLIIDCSYSEICNFWIEHGLLTFSFNGWQRGI